jgi:hypothetical protein
LAIRFDILFERYRKILLHTAPSSHNASPVRLIAPQAHRSPGSGSGSTDSVIFLLSWQTSLIY